jgi:hypothetical protein
VRDTERASLAILEATPAVLRELVAGLPGEIVAANLDRDWSIKRIVAHMADVDDTAFASRLRRIVEEDAPQLPSIDPLARLDAMDWPSHSVGSLLDSLRDGRATSTGWLRGLPDEALQRRGRHDAAGELTASNLLHYWAYHDLAHLRGIQRMVQSVLIHETAGISETMDV